MNCELRNVLPKLKNLKNLILLDFDNFGLFEFRKSIQGQSFVHNSFLWSFYGGGYRSKSTSSEKEKEIFDYLEKSKYDENSILKLDSIFQFYLKNDCFRFR
jgi:hypothetical protein